MGRTEKGEGAEGEEGELCGEVVEKQVRQVSALLTTSSDCWKRDTSQIPIGGYSLISSVLFLHFYNLEMEISTDQGRLYSHKSVFIVTLLPFDSSLAV